MIKKSAIAELSDDSNSPTTIYTVPDGKQSEIVMVWVTNPDSSNKQFHLEFYNASADTTTVLFDGYTINQKDFLQIGGQAQTFVMMQEGDKLKGYGNSNSNFKVIVSCLEHNVIIQGG